MPSAHPAGANALHEAVLAHVSLYQVTVPHVVRRLFFPPPVHADRHDALKKAGNLLSGLVRAGKLDSHNLPHGSFKYYTLSGAAPSADGLNYDLATLWFCCLTESRFHRLSAGELKAIFENPPSSHIRHTISQDKAGPVVYRLYMPSGEAFSKAAIYVRRQLREARNKQGLADWLDHGDYGFAILGETQSGCDRLRVELAKTSAGQPPLTYQVRIRIALGPQAESYSAALQSLNDRLKPITGKQHGQSEQAKAS